MAAHGNALSPSGVAVARDAFDAQAWRDWALQARAQAELPPGQPFYVALALDGTVRRSAAGAPKWEDIVDEFQTLTATATKLTGY